MPGLGAGFISGSSENHFLLLGVPLGQETQSVYPSPVPTRGTGSCSPLPSMHSRKGTGPGLPALTHVIGSPILPVVLIHLALLLGNLVENGSLFSEPS